jgi:DTW domain-containing protein YfiP
MLRLSPNVRSLPRVKFNPEGASAFRMRRQPRRECVSTLEAIFLVIERVLARTGSESKEHQALQAVFQHFVRQQMGFVEPGKDTRHQIAKALRAERRQKRCGGDMPGGVPSPRLNP